MKADEDTKHTNEFGDIETLQDTKYWFKRDARTLRKSLAATLKISPVILATIFVATLLIMQYANGLIDFVQALVYTIALFPVFLLGYFLLLIMITKGYDIDPYSGTHIDISKSIRRDKGRKE